jgi:O-antigen ligase
VKGAHRAAEAGLLLWLVAVVFGRNRIFRQPLVLPLLFYVLFSGISTALSAEPLLSWDRMKIVCLVLVAVLFAQNLKTLRQAKIMAAVLVVSAVLTSALTFWQMTWGVGVAVNAVPRDSAVAKAGLAPGDIIAAVGSKRLRTPDGFRKLIQNAAPGTALQLRLLRGNIATPLERITVRTSREDVMAAGLLSPSLSRGRPPRAQGTMAHYMVYAEILLQFALLTWGLAVASQRHNPRMCFLLVLATVAITGALALTKTRSALGAVLVVAMVVVLMAAGRRFRLTALAAFAVLAILGTIWIHHSRGFAWIDMRDPGTQYRVSAWKDGLQLVRQHPWFGVGMESIRTHWQQWHMQTFATFHVQQHFHSTWIQLAAERGLLATAAWTWFVVGYLAYLLRLARRARKQDWFAYGIVLGTLAAMLGFLVESVVQYNLGEEQAVVTLWFLAGMSFAVDRLLRAQENAQPS